MIISNISNEYGFDDGKIISYNKLLSDGPKLEELNGNINYLEYDKYTLPYSSNFITFINNFYNGYNLNNMSSNNGEPLRYQEFIKEYMKFGTPYRGILINHGLGSGKTRSCILVSETFRKVGLKTLFLGPASLKNNFIEELFKWGMDDIRLSENALPLEREKKRRVIDQYYKLISSNSSNVLVQLAKLGIGYPDFNKNLFNRGVANYLNKNNITKLNYPKNMLIIVEEAHNINQKFSSKSSKTLKKIYDFLKYAEDCKIIAVSATPIINKPFEICTMLNFLRGPLIDGTTILPESEDDFNALYINKENKLINKADLQVRILGLISYYKGIGSDRTQYPDLTYLDVIEIPMSVEQNALHDYFLELELIKYLNKDMNYKEELANTSLEKLLIDVEEKEKIYGKPQNSYRINSRTVCNYIWKIDPDDIDKPNMIILPHIFEFVNIDYKNPNIFWPLFFKTKPEESLETAINNFSFSKDMKFNYYDFIINDKSPLKLIKDIFTCAILLVYCNISRLPLVLKSSDTNIIKLKSKYNITPIKHFLTNNDILNLYDIIKSRKQKIDDAIAKMVQNGEKYFSNAALEKHSPKMLAILNNILNGPGHLEIDNDYIDEPKAGSNNYFEDDIIIDDDENIIELEEFEELNDYDMMEESENIDKKDTIKDPNLYLLYNNNILYPTIELINDLKIDINSADPNIIFEKLKIFINSDNNKHFINLLLNTNNKYILYTTQINFSNNTFYIKGNNNYGIALMYLRNFLNNTDISNINTFGLRFKPFDNIYSINNVKGGPAFVYSEFNNAEGIAIFSKILEYNGFIKFNKNEFTELDYEITKDDFAPRYAIISGNIDFDERSTIIRLFNNAANKHGQFIQILLGTSAASEGINLKFIRQVHIMEPFWHNIKIEQVIGRARRLTSHLMLPMDQREIFIFKYLSTSSTNVISTDEYLYKLAFNKYKMIEDIYSLLKGAAVDCNLNYAVNGDNIRCFKFPENMINVPAFKLNTESNNVKAEIIKEEEKVRLKAIETLDKKIIGYYKISVEIDSDIPIEKQFKLIPNDPKFLSYANKNIEVFPIYNEQSLNGIFIIIAYGYIKPNGGLQRFPKSIFN